MAALGELLFWRRDGVSLDDVLRHELGRVREWVEALPDKMFGKSDDEIVAHIAQEHAIQPLSANFGAAKANVLETQLEVHDQFGFNRTPVRVPGLLATKAIPFKGDPELWRLQTNPFNMNPPRGEIRANTLVIGITVRAQAADEAQRYIDHAIAQIPEYLQRQEAQIALHNASVATQALTGVRARRQRLGSAADLLKKLGG